MLEFIAEYGLFLAKVVTVVVAIIVVIASIASATHREKSQLEGHISVRDLNDKFEGTRDQLRSAIWSEERFKLEHKQQQKEEKRQRKSEKKALKKSASKSSDSNNETDNEISTENGIENKRLFVLDFNGDMQASAVSNLREEISAVLSFASKNDEIVLRLESPGGLVHSYGLAASQLQRIKAREIPLTICVDKVAASGGYMMACLGNKIIAAPFAVLGSIGVVAQIPNFHRVLKKNDVDVEILTAGEYKRTMTMLGENTDAGRSKFVEELEETHDLFKEWVAEHRTQLDVADVATGETWYGTRALKHKLVDEIMTSDDYIAGQIDEAKIFQIRYEEKKSLQQKFGMAASESMDGLIAKWWQRLSGREFL
ncbi:MAG: protease SohB [Pseudomonadales bacterium]